MQALTCTVDGGEGGVAPTGLGDGIGPTGLRDGVGVGEGATGLTASSVRVY